MTAVAVDQVDQLLELAPVPEPPIVIDHDGVYDRMSDEQYHGHRDSLSSSGARKLLPPSCPALFRHEQDHGRPPKRAFDLGHAAHQRVLGVGAQLEVVMKTAKDGTRSPATDYVTKSAQEHRDEIRAAGAVPILAKELEVVDAMADAILQHPLASVLFDPDRGGKPEQSLFWTDPEFDVMRRARLDWMPLPRPDGRLIVPDFKSTASAEPTAFTKSVFSYGYEVQAVFYTDGIRALGLADDVVFLFVAQEKTPPYLVTVHELDERALAIGRVRVDRALAVYEECLLTGEWPGYSSDVELVTPPLWLARQYEDLVP